MSANDTRILVVDDEPEVARGTAHLLEQLGYPLATALSGEEALQIMTTFRPHLVLLDWDLPGMDGVEVCRRIKRTPEYADVLVILISAIYTQSEEQVAGLKTGADGFITRPIPNCELAARVDAFAHILRQTRSLREQAEQLQQQNEEMEQFSYTVAHDMRAPLRAILGYTHLLQLECKDQVSETGKEYFSRITDAALRMDCLIEDVLSISRLTRARLELEPVDVDKVLQGILNSYPAFQPPEVQIRVQRPLPIVLANEPTLSLCISSLLTNAVKFVTPGLTPRIEIWAEQLSTSAPLNLPAPQRSVRLWFSDNGIGIAVDQQERIFDIFQRVNKDYAGTGIGLAIVRKAMQRMGGRVGLESEPGKGSRFWLEFVLPNLRRGDLMK